MPKRNLTTEAAVVPFAGLAATLGGMDLAAANAVGVEASTAYLGFHHMKGSRAGDIIAALGAGFSEGTPYISTGDNFYNAAGLCFQSLVEFRYWSVMSNAGGQWEQTAASLDPMTGKHDSGGDWKENMLSVTLMLPGTSPVPGDIGPVCATMSTWRSVKCGALKQHVRAVKRTLSSEWAQEGTNAALAASVPPRYRIASALRMEAITAKSGFVYHRAKALPSTINMDQLGALQAWLQDSGFQDQLGKINDFFESKKSEIEQLAG